MSLVAIGSVLASCARDPKHPNAPCNDTPGAPTTTVIVIAVLAIILILCVLLMIVTRRRDESHVAEMAVNMSRE